MARRKVPPPLFGSERACVRQQAQQWQLQCGELLEADRSQSLCALNFCSPSVFGVYEIREVLRLSRPTNATRPHNNASFHPTDPKRRYPDQIPGSHFTRGRFRALATTLAESVLVLPLCTSVSVLSYPGSRYIHVHLSFSLVCSSHNCRPSTGN